MKRFFIKLRHLTWRRVINKIRQIIDNMITGFTFRKIPQQNLELFEKLENIAGEIPDSNGSTYYSKADIKIGIITDEFMYNYYKDAARFITVGRDNFKEIIDNADIDILMYVSCWRGMHGDDWYGDERHGEIPEVIEYANARDITTVFQSIEDPTNYERYLPIAAKCDYIFTTDADCVERYKEDTGNENSFLLEYGVNPLFHNPIGINKKYSRENEYDHFMVFFAGSWMDRYKNRCRDMNMIFSGVLESGIGMMIADRNAWVKLPGYRFPRKFQGFTVPAIEHTLLQKVHKMFDFNVNINTVQDSPSMCAMRVYELQALGCLMISNYSLAVSENFPGLFMINESSEVGEILKGYSRKELYRMQVENLRNVMSDKTVFDRLNYIFEKSGVNHRFAEKRVTVLCREKTEKIRSMFEAQEYGAKALMEEDRYDIAKNESDFVAYFDEKNDYGRYYLTDMLNAFKYCDTDFVTKDERCGAEEYGFTEKAHDVGRTVMTAEKYAQLCAAESDEIRGRGFRIDGFEINETEERSGQDKEIAVIVPVYNNGEYLRGRCFRSLLRSGAFDIMQIYLIDDGSDDEDTVKTIKELEMRYDNVTSYFFEKGGSGSAARPRNKGVEISHEPYITYLDPDNEAVGNGYLKLYEKIKSTGADMAFGAIQMRATSQKLMRIGYLLKSGLINDPRDLLVSENFRTQSIQACLVRRELITENGLENPEGAFGEDTLFFDELMLNAEKVYYLNELIHIYYAQRMNSSINDIGAGFFEKSLILERYQVRRLSEYGLLDEYKRRKLDYFIINWYIEKLGDASAQEKEKCIETIAEIVALYGKTIDDYAAYIKEKQ